MKLKINKLSICFFIISFLLFVNINPVINGYISNVSQKNSIAETFKGNIMLTGFWNPTGKMIKSFSTSNYLNPEGWKGENWENLGYNIFSYFPTPDIYNGTFEVDYQNTWNNFWNITSEINPIAIISFGAGNGPWEIEYNARNLDFWINDDEYPYQPTPNPPDDTVDVGYVRHSTLPIEEIEIVVNDETDIGAWIDWNGDPGRYLCEFIAYLGMWYQEIHNSSDDVNQCLSAGFIHVNSNVPLIEAMKATNITIRKTIEFLDSFNKPPAKPMINGVNSGKAGVEYEFEFSTTDPDGDEVFYWILWFEGCPGVSWDGPYNSGEIVTKSYTYTEEGDYTISVKAKDSNGAESDWTTLEVSMPKNKSINDFNLLIFRLIQRFPILELLI